MNLIQCLDPNGLFVTYSGVKMNIQCNYLHFLIAAINPVLSFVLKSLLNINNPFIYIKDLIILPLYMKISDLKE